MTIRGRDREEHRLTNLPDLPEVTMSARSTRRDDSEELIFPRTKSEIIGKRPNAHEVPSTGRSVGSSPKQRSSSNRSRSEAIVFPPGRFVIAQAVPNLAVAAALLFAGESDTFLRPGGAPLWTVMVLAPSLFLVTLSNPGTNPLWRRTGLVNLVTIGIILPILSIRRYLVQLPYEAAVEGPVLASSVASVAALVSLLALGFIVAVLTREDPEYAGVMILPACMLMPLFGGGTHAMSLENSMSAAGFVFVASAAAIVIASLVPTTISALVAPAILAAELVALTVVGEVEIFPTEAARPITVLFLALLLTAVLLTVLLPVMSEWCSQVRIELHRMQRTRDQRS